MRRSRALVLAVAAAIVTWLAGTSRASANEYAVHLPIVQRGTVETVTLRLRPHAPGVTVWGDLWVDVEIEGGNAIAMLAAEVRYEPAALLAIDEDPDGYLIEPLPGDWPPPGRGYLSCHADNGAGRLRCSLQRYLDAPRPGVLARLRLTGRAPGETRLTVAVTEFWPRRPMGAVRVRGGELAVTIAPRSEPSYATCPTLPGERYGRLSVLGEPSAVPAEQQPDLNLGRRGAELVEAHRGLIDHTGPSDPRAPQLGGLSALVADPARIVAFTGAWQLQDWSWAEDHPAGLLAQWPTTLVGVPVPPAGAVHVPASGYDIGSGYEVLVLYAAPGRVTLKYTREDNVVAGYTLHVEGVCLDPQLQELYNRSVRDGRTRLPALRAGQAFGTAPSGEVLLAIRDTGQFMDPRSRKDWWHGYVR